MNKKLQEALNYDGLAEAEKVTGKSYKDDEETERLGFIMSIVGNQRKNNLLEETGDTNFNTTFAVYEEIAEKIGFVKGFERFYDDGTRLCIYHYEGFILKIGTYKWDSSSEESINTAILYYNLVPKDPQGPWRWTSSGSYRDGIWAGDHDVREGLKHKISMLQEFCIVLPKWKRRPFFWFIQHNDKENNEVGHAYKDRNRKVIEQSSPEIQEIIGPE